ncbi:MAG: TRIC cation channel family protein, partial [Kiritimatiellae bacterium]|nr:TRIC cation channel family protein [Kiritimatiellia bacterium]
MDPIIHALDVIGTAVFAVTGALAAGRKRMDVFGVVVLGCVTALGGGTMRDLILGIRPVFWITETPYLAVAVLASA